MDLEERLLPGGEVAAGVLSWIGADVASTQSSQGRKNRAAKTVYIYLHYLLYIKYQIYPRYLRYRGCDKIKRLITTPKELDKLIDEYNQRNPFEHLNISGIASKAIYERIISIYPDLRLGVLDVVGNSSVSDIDIETYSQALQTVYTTGDTNTIPDNPEPNSEPVIEPEKEPDTKITRSPKAQ